MWEDTAGALVCRGCGARLIDIHGHLACYGEACRLYGQTQVACCEGAPGGTPESPRDTP